ncbi:hypothetical protein [Mycobacteroides abscessus]|uniref:hypothetical protein n=1 Tax=Mycobacteroides abscessus TaxID=36809 RepID=UPI00266F2A12|nr:hypothetical protein [Mycobacteroides abscessus]MDO3110480.1 hypothetical protein [Mycobacteroides abscessus subsp. abscessus]
MKYPNKIGAALALAAAAVATLTACDPGPEQAASSSAAANSTVSVAAGGDLPARGVAVDAQRYQAAMQQGRPYIYGIPDGPDSACHVGLVIPQGLSGAGEWLLPDGGVAPVEGVAFTRGPWLAASGCSFDRLTPGGAVTPPTEYGNPGKGSLNPAAQAAAAAEGRPFFYALPSDADPACHSAVRLPDGQVWVMNTPGSAPVTGIALSKTVNAYGCREAGVR